MSFLRGFRAILFKEFLVVFRDRGTLFFMFFPPLLQIIAFGFALDNDVKHMALVVFNEDRTIESRQLVDAFVNTQTFRVIREVHSRVEMEAEVRRGRAYAGLQIPPEYTRELRAGRRATVQVLIDGSNSTTALQALNTALGVGLRRSVELLLGETGRRELPVEVRPQVLYNPAMRAPNFFVPGVIGTALQIATVFAVAMAIVRERERGTLENLLVSPLSRWGLMLGKLVPYLCTSMTMALFLFTILRWVFGVPIRGSLVLLFAAALFYIFALACLGLLVSTRAKSQNEAMQMSMSIMLPSIFFSGFIFPRETLPAFFYGISTLLPATYFIELMRAIILRGATLAEFWRHLLILATMGAVFFVLCALRFKKKLA
ncbi:MAG: putative multidrug ABC transporter permease YbhR [Verrucomicrobiae bacterium]|nr:putative multidrug ABC transporter permease YbhR [Verrucomicrobiae bacterium]